MSEGPWGCLHHRGLWGGCGRGPGDACVTEGCGVVTLSAPRGLRWEPSLVICPSTPECSWTWELSGPVHVLSGFLCPQTRETRGQTRRGYWGFPREEAIIY